MIVYAVIATDSVAARGLGQRGRPWPRERVVPAAKR